jgi:hypothetical protein
MYPPGFSVAQTWQFLLGREDDAYSDTFQITVFMLT